MSPGRRHLGRVVHLDPVALHGVDAVGDVGRRHQQVEVVLALQPLAHDVHVQQAEEPAAEPEAQRLRGLRLVGQRRVVQLQPLQSVAQLRVRVGVGREQAREHHRLDVLVARQRLLGASLGERHRVPHPQLGDVLEAGHQVAHLAGGQMLGRPHAGREEAQLLDLEAGALHHRLDGVALVERAVDHPHEGEHAAVLVVGRVEDQGPRRRLRVALGRRDVVDHRLQHAVHAEPGLGRDPQHVVRRVTDQLGDFERDGVRIGGLQVDLVDHRDDVEVVLDGQVGVGQGLCLKPLRRVHHQQRALAGSQAAAHLVGEVDVAGRVDQVQLVDAVVGRPEHDPHRLGLDGDAPLALEIHRVEHLVAHLPLGHRLGDLEDAVGQRRLAVVDVGDDREVADSRERHRSRLLAPPGQQAPHRLQLLQMEEPRTAHIGGPGGRQRGRHGRPARPGTTGPTGGRAAPRRPARRRRRRGWPRRSAATPLPARGGAACRCGAAAGRPARRH